MPKVYIKVFVTKTLQFRAVIKPEDSFAREITVGGDRWEAGEYAELHARILEKCRALVGNLSDNLKAAGGVPGEQSLTREDINSRIGEFAVACYKRGFQRRHGPEVVREWTLDPAEGVRGLVRDFLKKIGRRS